MAHLAPPPAAPVELQTLSPTNSYHQHDDQSTLPPGVSHPRHSSISKAPSPHLSTRHASRDSISTPSPAHSRSSSPPTFTHHHHHHDADANLEGQKGPTTQTEEKDANVIDFSGPSDPYAAQSWTVRKKWSQVATLSFMTFISPLASSMFAPGVPQVLRDFHASDQLLASFVVSVYVLGYAVGPLVVAPLSEIHGRVPLYHVTNGLFVVMTVACALSTNLNMLIGFRFLAGCAGSSVLTMGGGTIGDMFRQDERGGAMAIWSIGPLIGPVVGPVVGPVAGGFLIAAKGWRWVFWVLAVASGVGAGACGLVLRESYPVVLLERKVAALRASTGNPHLRSSLDAGLDPTDLFKRAIVRPTKMLFFSPVVLALSVFIGVAYGYLYLLFTTITEVFEGQYGFSQGVVGLTFLGIGVGMFTGLLVTGYFSDRIVKSLAARQGEMKPEFRLPLMIPAAFAVPVGLFIYGWSADKHVHWFVPIFGTSFVGLGLIGTFMPVITYLVDAFTIHAASALAANTLLRSIAGALLPLAGPKMYARLGLGWGNSLLGFVALAMIPLPYLFYKYGERIRTWRRFQVQF